MKKLETGSIAPGPPSLLAAVSLVQGEESEPTPDPPLSRGEMGTGAWGQACSS